MPGPACKEPGTPSINSAQQFVRCLAQRFDQLDKNKDGRLTADERPMMGRGMQGKAGKQRGAGWIGQLLEDVGEGLGARKEHVQRPARLVRPRSCRSAGSQPGP